MDRMMQEDFMLDKRFENMPFRGHSVAGYSVIGYRLLDTLVFAGILSRSVENGVIQSPALFRRATKIGPI
jgi:hypothetical protein